MAAFDSYESQRYGNGPPFSVAVQQRASLGCGSFILIALIVLIFSNASGSNRTDLTPVLKKLNEIENRIERLERQLKDVKVLEGERRPMRETPA